MDNLVYALIFYVLGAVVRTVYGFMAKIVSSNNNDMQFDAKYWATMVMSIIVSFMGAVGTFALVVPPDMNVVAVFLMAFPSGYAVNDAANRGVGLVHGSKAKAGSQKTVTTTEGTQQ